MPVIDPCTLIAGLCGVMMTIFSSIAENMTNFGMFAGSGLGAMMVGFYGYLYYSMA